MIQKGFSHLRGVLSLSIYFVNTIFWCSVLFFFSLLKMLIPLPPVQKLLSGLLNWVATNWIWVNNLNQKLLCNIHWELEGLDGLREKGWYLVISNHQTWVDILVLQNIFHKKIPFLKFFLKKELFWFPIMGQAWWALDFPFMRRYSKAFLKKNPHLKGKDLEITKKACEKFKSLPVSVMNFVEGTRLTKEKHRQQGSPFRYLLRPKAGGIAFVLSAMGEHFEKILDVTIAYPEGAQSCWAFLCGKVHHVKVKVRSIDVTEEILGDYFQDEAFREKFQLWLNRVWEEKDVLMKEMLSDASAENPSKEKETVVAKGKVLPN